MGEAIKLAVLVENNKILRKEISRQINSTGVQEIIECASPNLTLRPIMISKKPGILVISNDDKQGGCLRLVRFCQERSVNWTILVLDHLNTDQSAAEAFAAGADDVLHVPFSTEEFKARLKLRVLQTLYPKGDDSSTKENTLAKAGLTQTELEIMDMLIAKKGEIVTRNQLAQHLENKDWVYGDRKYDVHITNIRKKLRDSLTSNYAVKSVRSVGYYIQQANKDGGTITK